MPSPKQRTMFIDPQDGVVWRVIAQAKPEDCAPCVILRADDWRKPRDASDRNKDRFATARAMQDNPFQHCGTYFHSTEAEARDWLGIPTT